MERYAAGVADAPGFDKPLRLASNESSWGPSPEARRAVRQVEADFSRYPDRDAKELRLALAEANRIEADRIVCGNGSDELIALLARAVAGAGTEVIHSDYGFRMYRIAAEAALATPVSAPETALTTDVDAILSLVTEKTRLVFVANPNNPTGTCLPIAEIERLHAGLPGSVTLALDAAYSEYVTDPAYDAGYALARRADNVVVLRTFSKIHGLAALRIGWMYGPVRIVRHMDAMRPPFNANAAAQAAAIASVQDRRWTDRVGNETNAARSRFVRDLERMGLEAVPEEGNFVLVHFPATQGSDAKKVFGTLRARGIIVRPVDAYGLPEHLRITIGRPAEMRRVVAALKDAVGAQVEGTAA